MHHKRLAPALLLALLLPIFAIAQAPVRIDFDDLDAPCDLASAQPLRDEYLAQGVRFRSPSHTEEGGGAVLGECSSYSVAGHSSPNFVVVDTAGQLSNGAAPDLLLMDFDDLDKHPDLVRAQVGGEAGTEVSMICTVCPWAIPSCSPGTSVILGTGMSTIELRNEDRFSSCYLGVEPLSGGWFVVDDLQLAFASQQQVPVLSPLGITVLVALLGAFGLLVLRRLG